MRIHPCTGSEETWSGRHSMKSLFGDLCYGANMPDVDQKISSSQQSLPIRRKKETLASSDNESDCATQRTEEDTASAFSSDSTNQTGHAKIRESSDDEGDNVSMSSSAFCSDDPLDTMETPRFLEKLKSRKEAYSIAKKGAWAWQGPLSCSVEWRAKSEELTQ